MYDLFVFPLFASVFYDLEFKALRAKDREFLAYNQYYDKGIILKPYKW